jgi:protein O-GlcNAc transferase
MSNVSSSTGQIASVDPRRSLDPAAWHHVALGMLRAGRLAEALPPASNAVNLAPLALEYRLSLAAALVSNGLLAPAIAQFELARRLSASDPRVLNGLASALQLVALFPEAARLYRETLAIDPQNTTAQRGFAAAQRAVLAEPTAAVGAQVLGMIREAERLLAGGQRFEALNLYTQCARLVPQSPRVYYWIACLLHDLARAEAALAYYELAARMDPRMPLAATNAGKIAASLGLAARAAAHLKRAQNLKPNYGLSVLSSLLLDAIYESDADIEQSRRRFSAGVDRILEDPTQVTDPLRELAAPTFYLAYHGRCNRELHTRLARAFAAKSPGLHWTAPHCEMERRRGERIRVGFISQFLRNHSIGKTTRGLVAQLNRERFEVYVINIPPAVTDETSSWIKARADHWMTLPDDLQQARAQLASLQLDILFYQDIGLEPFSYFLAFARLAPVQCVSFGHPDTTGIPTIDYFISSDLYETPEADEHYSERLVRLHNLPSLAYYYRPERRGVGRTRIQFGLSETERIYLCPQTLFKVHPDFDRLMAGILERDPSGRILLISAHSAEWSMRLQGRFARNMSALSERIQFLPALALGEFLNLLSVVDVLLDTVHFNGMNTSLEAFSVGTPVVTLPGHLQRSRHTQAMYRAMGIDGCVADSEESYIDIAVRLATDRDQQRGLRALIAQRNQVLFEDSCVVSQFEGFFERALQESM